MGSRNLELQGPTYVNLALILIMRSMYYVINYLVRARTSREDISRYMNILSSGLKHDPRGE